MTKGNIKDAPILIIALLIIIISGYYVFKKGETIHPKYGWHTIFGDMQYPQQLNLNSTYLKGNNTEDNSIKLDNIFYGTKNTGNNVCQNFNCNLKGSPLNKTANNNNKDTPYCIIPNVKKKMDSGLCPAKGDQCYGNCNILYDTLVKKNIDENSGMKGVEQILKDIEIHSGNGPNKNEIIQKQYKNQIKHFLHCNVTI